MSCDDQQPWKFEAMSLISDSMTRDDDLIRNESAKLILSGSLPSQYSYTLHLAT